MLKNCISDKVSPRDKSLIVDRARISQDPPQTLGISWLRTNRTRHSDFSRGVMRLSRARDWITHLFVYTAIAYSNSRYSVSLFGDGRISVTDGENNGVWIWPLSNWRGDTRPEACVWTLGLTAILEATICSFI